MGFDAKKLLNDIADKLSPPKTTEQSQSPSGQYDNTQVASLKRKAVPIQSGKKFGEGSSYLTTNRYYFQIRKTDDDGSILPMDKGSSFPGGKFMGGADEGKYSMRHYDINSGIALDVPPSSIAVSTPFAVSLTATNDGVLEESNGVVFRHIKIAGTTGVYIDRKLPMVSAEAKGARKILENLFPAATQALGALGDTLRSVTGTKNNGDKTQDDIQDMAKYGGAAQFWRLHNFFIAAAELKKLAANQNVRLVFGCPRDGIEYVCSAVSFDWKKSASDPMLYQYDITLTAFDIGSASSLKAKEVKLPTPKDPSTLKSILSRLLDARNTMIKAKNVLLGVNNDVQSVFNVVAQGINVVKDGAGAANDILDFPAFFSNNVDKIIYSAWDSTMVEINKLKESGDERAKRVLGHDLPPLRNANIPILSSLSNDLSFAGQLFADAIGASETQVATFNSPTGEQKSASNNIASQNLEAKAAFLKIMNQIPEAASNIVVDELDIPDALKEELDHQKEESLNTTSGAMRELCKDIQEMSDNLAASIGMMDPQYAATYGLPVPTTGRQPTEDDIILMASLQDTKSALLETLSSGEVFVELNPDPYLSARRFLSDSDDLPTPNSAYVATVNGGEDIQSLSKRLLGDANRWREIAILNDLRPPYIESTEHSQSFASPSGRTILVSDITNLAINQHIKIVGNFTTQRKILNIENLGSTYRITFDGIDNLTSINSANNRIVFHTVGTVGPGSDILIPSEDAPITQTFRSTSLYESISNAEKVFEIDVALDKNGDVKVGPDGDALRSVGYANAEQAINLLLTIEKGELEQFPDYGVSVPVGSRNSDLTPEQIEEMTTTAIKSDPRFSDAQAILRVNGSEVELGIVARGANGTGLVPLSFKAGLE